MTTPAPHPQIAEAGLAGLDALRTDLERVFLAAGETLIAMDGRIRELHEPLGRLEANAAPALAAVGTYADGVARSVADLDADLDRYARETEDLRQTVLGLSGTAADVARKLRMMKYVATNAQIDTAALAKRHPGIDGFVHTARAMVDDSIEMLARLDRNTGRITGDFGLLAQDLIPGLRGRARTLDADFEAVRSAVAAFAADQQNAATFGASLSAVLGRLSGDFNDAIMALQTGDRASQRIDHALQIAREAPVHAPLAELAAALLAGASDDLREETRKITRTLGEALAHFEEIAGLHGAGSTEQRLGRFDELMTQVGRARGSVDAIRAGREGLLQGAETVTANTDDLRAVLHELSSLAEDLRLIGTNGVLACARLEREGDALREISRQLRLLAGESANQIGEVWNALERTDQRISTLVGDIRAGSADCFGDVESQGGTVVAELRSILEAGSHVTGRCGDLLVSLHRTVPEACTALLAQVDRLDALLPSGAARGEGAGEGDVPEEVLIRIWSIYSMDAERDIHREICRALGLEAPAATAMAPGTVEADIFF